MTVQEDARLVLDYLEQHGWTQWAMQDHSGRACLYGATSRALSRAGEPLAIGERPFTRREEALFRALEIVINGDDDLLRMGSLLRPVSWDRLHIWNDSHDRDYSHVVTALKRIIDS